MTKEMRLLFDLSDISAIKLTCMNEECGIELAQPPTSLCKLPKKCPSCGESWSHSVLEQLNSISIAIGRILNYKTMPVELHMEMRLPYEEKPRT